MSLIEAVFKRSGDNRAIPFSEIAAETRLPNEEVSEHFGGLGIDRRNA